MTDQPYHPPQLREVFSTDPSPTPSVRPEPQAGEVAADVWWGWAYNDPQLWSVPCPYMRSGRRRDETEATDDAAA